MRIFIVASGTLALTALKNSSKKLMSSVSVIAQGVGCPTSVYILEGNH